MPELNEDQLKLLTLLHIQPMNEYELASVAKMDVEQVEYTTTSLIQWKLAKYSHVDKSYQITQAGRDYVGGMQ